METSHGAGTSQESARGIAAFGGIQPHKWIRLLITTAVSLVLLASGIIPTADAQIDTSVPEIEPEQLLPPPFNTDMSWTEQGGWHWVTISYEFNRRQSTDQYDVSVGQQLGTAWLAATRVRSLSPTDPCEDCYSTDNGEQGPPAVMGGRDNPLLRAAYDNLDNGSRRQIEADPGADTPTRWTQGSWYLNFNPETGTFHSWTWIPNDWTTLAEQRGIVPDTTALPYIPPEIQESHDAAGSAGSQPVPNESRIFPLMGDYQITQGFGCVGYDPGYSAASFCPEDRPSFHNAIDLAAPAGTVIYAAASGYVSYSQIDSGSEAGNSIIRIEHDGYTTEYFHWETTYVMAGDWVAAGDPIATIGSVGYSSGPHLHFSVFDATNGTWIDPLIWLSGAVQPWNIDDPVLQWASLIRESANQHQVPAALIAAVISVESNGNPNALSPAGARGLMQVMPFHLERYQVSPDRWHDPAANIDAGARFLAESYWEHGSIERAAARYFGNGCDVHGTCTEDYVTRVVEAIEHFKPFFTE